MSRLRTRTRKVGTSLKKKKKKKKNKKKKKEEEEGEEEEEEDMEEKKTPGNIYPKLPTWFIFLFSLFSFFLISTPYNATKCNPRPGFHPIRVRYIECHVSY
jgi:hypothetical protein